MGSDGTHVVRTIDPAGSKAPSTCQQRDAASESTLLSRSLCYQMVLNQLRLAGADRQALVSMRSISLSTTPILSLLFLLVTRSFLVKQYPGMTWRNGVSVPSIILHQNFNIHLKTLLCTCDTVSSCLVRSCHCSAPNSLPFLSLFSFHPLTFFLLICS